MKDFDNSFLTNGISIVAGVDEAGRGPLAGPVVAAAVIFDNDFVIPGVNDSKQLSHEQREFLFPQIISGAKCWSVTVVSHTVVDEINILQASLQAMKTSVDKLNIKPELVLIDGNRSYNKNDSRLITIVKGDSKSFAIASASIIAKVVRDRIMVKQSKKYPCYKWDKNKGYGTKEHIVALKEFGKSPLHRNTFLKNILPDSQIVLQYEPENSI